MNEQKPICVPPISDLRKEIVTRQAELRRLRKMLLLAKAVATDEPGNASESTARRASQ